jgi:hypothetical protein
VELWILTLDAFADSGDIRKLLEEVWNPKEAQNILSAKLGAA